jgi:hypothetical protein
MVDLQNMGAVGLALWGVAAASLTAALTFATAWLIIKGALIATELYRRWRGAREPSNPPRKAARP